MYKRQDRQHSLHRWDTGPASPWDSSVLSWPTPQRELTLCKELRLPACCGQPYCMLLASGAREKAASSGRAQCHCSQGGGPVCGLEEVCPPQPSPATPPPAHGLMASRCGALSRGLQPHPKPQPWPLPEGPSQGDLFQARVKGAHTLGLGKLKKKSSDTSHLTDVGVQGQGCGRSNSLPVSWPQPLSPGKMGYIAAQGGNTSVAAGNS